MANSSIFIESLLPNSMGQEGLFDLHAQLREALSRFISPKLGISYDNRSFQIHKRSAPNMPCLEVAQYKDPTAFLRALSLNLPNNRGFILHTDALQELKPSTRLLGLRSPFELLEGNILPIKHRGGFMHALVKVVGEHTNILKGVIIAPEDMDIGGIMQPFNQIPGLPVSAQTYSQEGVGTNELAQIFKNTIMLTDRLAGNDPSMFKVYQNPQRK